MDKIVANRKDIIFWKERLPDNIKTYVDCPKPKHLRLRKAKNHHWKNFTSQKEDNSQECSDIFYVLTYYGIILPLGLFFLFATVLGGKHED